MPKLQCIFSSDIEAHPAIDTKGISLKVKIYSFPKRVLESQSICSLSEETRLVIGMEEGWRGCINWCVSSLNVYETMVIATAASYYCDEASYYFDDSRL